MANEEQISISGWLVCAALILSCALVLLFGARASLESASVHRYEIAKAIELEAVFETIGYHYEDIGKGLDAAPRAYLNRFPKGWSSGLPSSQKKQFFYQAMLPLVLTVNKEILRERRGVQTLAGLTHLTTDQEAFLEKVAEKYKMRFKTKTPSSSELGELVRRIDAIPVSLALGQAAYESGYATSRFAAIGNALFGQWKWGKGIVPKEQRSGKGDYHIATFATPLDSVRAYALNLNSHRAYRAFRQERERQRRAGLSRLSGRELVQTLKAYSERGVAYVETLNGMIEKNNLWVLDSAKLGNGPLIEVKFIEP